MAPRVFQVVVSNLLRNAFSHGGPAVSVLIRAERQDLPPALVLQVVDDGVGPPPGWQAAPAHAPLRPGSQRPAPRGLGLYIARELCRANQATLEYVPVPGGGSCFRITLPGPSALLPA